LLSLLMRWHLAWADSLIPGWGLIKPEDYLALLSLHGTLMIFFVTSAAPQNGLASLILPEQLRGARSPDSEARGSTEWPEVRMALPLLNALSVWLTLFALLALLSTPFLPGGNLRMGILGKP
jgi:cytochrome c oxidase subunit 1